MQAFVNQVSGFIWNPVFIVLCLGAGLFYSYHTRFVQVRLFSEMCRLLFTGRQSDKGISSFQALSLALSGRVGTGNIAGVAAAIGFGGPGAVFWMWVVAFLGAATAFVESTLAQIYKEELDGQYRGGPAYYIEKAIGKKWYANTFAIAVIMASAFFLAGIQANSIGNAMALAFGEGDKLNTPIGMLSSTKLLTALFIVIALGFIMIGGVRRIANFTQIVVPFMALGFILIAIAVIVMNIEKLPSVIMLIMGDAFSPMAGFGAAVGIGVKRGVYSNGAGLGTGPQAAAAAEVDHPVQQGLVQAFSVYIDTLLVCSATAFMILITGTYNVHIGDGFLIQNLNADIIANSPMFTQSAVDHVFPGIGIPFVACALFFFAFTTILADYYSGETNLAYLKRTMKITGLPTALKVAMLASTFYGTVKTADLAWSLGDIGVGVMAWLNILGILIIFYLSRPAIKALHDYERQRNLGVDSYTFDPEKLGIVNATFWAERIKQTSSQTHNKE